MRWANHVWRAWPSSAVPRVTHVSQILQSTRSASDLRTWGSEAKSPLRSFPACAFLFLRVNPVRAGSRWAAKRKSAHAFFVKQLFLWASQGMEQ